MVKNNSQDRDSPGYSPGLVEVLGALGGAYRERHKQYNERGPCPPSNPDGSKSPEEAAWLATWQPKEEALHWYPLAWLCERIVNLTGVDDDLDFNDVKEASLNYGSGWHFFKSQPTGMPDRRVPRKITRELRALDRDGFGGPIIQGMVTKYRDHPDIAELLGKFSHLKPQAKRGGSKRQRPKPTELTKREHLVKLLLDAGQPQAKIADTLGITEGRVSQIVRKIKSKEKATRSRSVGMGKAVSLRGDYSANDTTSKRTKRQRKRSTD